MKSEEIEKNNTRKKKANKKPYKMYIVFFFKNFGT